MLEDNGAAQSELPDLGRSKVEPGMYIAYALDPSRKLRTIVVGKVLTLMKHENSPIQVHKHVATWDQQVRLKWLPLFYDAEGGECTNASAFKGQAVLENISYQLLEHCPGASRKSIY